MDGASTDGAAAAASGTTAQPELLQQLYGSTETLGAYLQRTLRPAPLAGVLLRKDDPQDYRYVMERCLVAQRHPRTEDAQPGALDLATAVTTPILAAAAAEHAGGYVSSQPEVVRQAIESLFRESAQPDHVLALGHCRPRFGGTGSSSFHGVERLIPSSASSALQTAPWVALLQRVGDAAMLAMLLECSLFLPTLGGTLVQLTGPPVNKVVHQMRAPPAAASSSSSAHGGTAAAPASPPFKRPRPAGSGHASEELQSGPTPPPTQSLPGTGDAHGITQELGLWASADAPLAASSPKAAAEAQPQPHAAAAPTSKNRQTQPPQPQPPAEALPRGRMTEPRVPAPVNMDT